MNLPSVTTYLYVEMLKSFGIRPTWPATIACVEEKDWAIKYRNG